jgi:hypothetical protein
MHISATLLVPELAKLAILHNILLFNPKKKSFEKYK